jgi:hypothetical protein
VGIYDGHLEYRANCYRTFMFMQPLYVTPVVDDNKNTRLVIYDVDPSAADTFGKYKGYEIVQIDGGESVKVIQSYAELHYGKFRASKTRFARALATRYYDADTKGFMIDRGSFFKRSLVPDKDSVTYTMRAPGQRTNVTLSVPWTVRFIGKGGTFGSAKEYWNLHCANQQGGAVTADSVNSVDDLKDTIPSLSSADFTNGATEPKMADVPLPPGAAQHPTLVQDGPGFGFFTFKAPPGTDKKNDELIAVLVIATFSVDKSRDDEWYTKIRIGLRAVQAAGATRLLIDVSNNGGGRICLAQSLIRLFMPEMATTKGEGEENTAPKQDDKPTKASKPSVKTLRRISPAARAAQAALEVPKVTYGFKSAYGFITVAPDAKDILRHVEKVRALFPIKTPLLPQVFASPDSGARYADTVTWSQLKVDVPKMLSMDVRDGPIQKPYTMNGPLVDYCPPHQLDTPVMNPYRYGKVGIISNGACGSACAILVAYLQTAARSLNKVNTVYMYATNTGNPPPAFAFAGGQVLTSEDIFRLYNVPKLLAQYVADLAQQVQKDASKKPQLDAARAIQIPPELRRPWSFPTNAKLSFTYRGIYMVRSDEQFKTVQVLPLEFYDLPASLSARVTPYNALNVEAQWQAASGLLGWSMPVNELDCERQEAYAKDKQIRSALVKRVCDKRVTLQITRQVGSHNQVQSTRGKKQGFTDNF